LPDTVTLPLGYSFGPSETYLIFLPHKILDVI